MFFIVLNVSVLISLKPSLLNICILDKRTALTSLGRISSYDQGISISTWRGIKISEKGGGWGGTMFAHLNEDGNIVNRDYNIDLKKFIGNKNNTPIQIIAGFLLPVENLTILYPRYAIREVMLACKKTALIAANLPKLVIMNRNIA